MKKLRILSLMLAVVFCVLALAACKKEPVEDTPSNTTNETVTTLSIVQKSKTEYVIVRDYRAGDSVIDAVARLRDAFNVYLGTDITVEECFTDRDPEVTNDRKEILVGVTTRKESNDTLKDLLCADYTMAVVGDKLVLGGGGEEGTAKAVSTFLSSFVYKQGDKFAVADKIPQNLTFTSKDNATVNGRYSYSSAVLFDARIDSYYLVYEKNNAAAKQIASSMFSHIAKETGYELVIDSDLTDWYDYEILIGNTARSDGDMARRLGANEYYISAKPTEVTYEDGSKHPGATIQILFGENAAESAFAAFKKNFIPPLSEPAPLNISAEKVVTNKT